MKLLKGWTSTATKLDLSVSHHSKLEPFDTFILIICTPTKYVLCGKPEFISPIAVLGRVAAPKLFTFHGKGGSKNFDFSVS